jgi:tRNA-dihydrouridine synthase B
MDGISDSPFRQLVRRLGSAISFSEFINAVDLKGKRRAHYLEQRITFDPIERPFAYQLLDDDLDRMVNAAKILRERDPDFFDLNLGCSARTVTGHGAGAALLKEPKKVASIISALCKATDLPVTAKIRLGWDETCLNYIEIAHIIEDNGGKLISVHALSKKQAFSGRANWQAIAQIKQAVSIPVIANGDVASVADINEICSMTGCDAVMIGRAALENPWLFSRLERSEVSPSEVKETMLRYLADLQMFYGDKMGLMRFRKFAIRLLKPYSPPRELMLDIVTTLETDHFYHLLDNVFNAV